MRWPLLLVLFAGCGGVLPSVPSEQDILAVEQQRARVAVVFALAKPFDLKRGQQEEDDYRGPLRSKSPPAGDAEESASIGTKPSPASVWMTDKNAAMQLAVRTSRKLLVVVSPADWKCAPCDKLVEAITPDLEGSLGEHWVALKWRVADADRPDFATSYPAAFLATCERRGSQINGTPVWSGVVDGGVDQLRKLLEEHK